VVRNVEETVLLLQILNNLQLLEVDQPAKIRTGKQERA
jgi:hypothetical protein